MSELKTTLHAGNFTWTFSTGKIDSSASKKAHEIFDHYHKAGVLTNESFSDDIWMINDEAHWTSIHFDLPEADYSQHGGLWSGYTLVEYQTAMKTYLSFKLGKTSLSDMHRTSMILIDMASGEDPVKISKRSDAKNALEFLNLLPKDSPERQNLIQLFEAEVSGYKPPKTRHRALADFASFLRFGRAMEAFWDQAVQARKLLFFPLYLWWNLTMILPLRPTEFVVTPRECIRKTDSGYQLTVRRTRMKGGGAKTYGYRLDTDYEKCVYTIPEDLAKEILWYKESVSDYLPSPADTLFCRGPLEIRNGDSRPLQYLDLANLLNQFYEEEIQDQGISRIRLGDTRHLAMISLIISGGSPTVCMKLAGHDDISVSSNYYANMSGLVECAAYELYIRKQGNPKAEITGNERYSVEPTEDMTRVEGGWCRSKLFRQGKVDHCAASFGPNGEIGEHCYCSFFRPEIQGIQLHLHMDDQADEEKRRIEELKKQVDSDSAFLLNRIEEVRKNRGEKESILQAILKLQHSSHDLKEAFLEFYSRQNRIIDAPDRPEDADID